MHKERAALVWPRFSEGERRALRFIRVETSRPAPDEQQFSKRINAPWHDKGGVMNAFDNRHRSVAKGRVAAIRGEEAPLTSLREAHFIQETTEAVYAAAGKAAR